MTACRILFAGILATVAWAQFPSAPPPILQVIRKPGASSAQAYGRGGGGIELIGLLSVTGVPETWLLATHGSFASVEAMDQAAAQSTGDAPDELAAPLTMLAVYRPGWSYRPADASRQFPKARYVLVTVVRLRPGGEADFAELVRLRHATSDSVNLDRPDIVYQVISGTNSGTFLFFTPLASLRILDEGVGPVPAYAEGVAAARAKEGPRIAADTVISREHLVLRVEPRLSSVSDAFAESDSEFWRGRSAK